MNAGQVICLMRAPNPVQAHLWASALRAQGIKFQVVGDFPGLGFGDISGIQPEIWVRRQDFIRAKRAFREFAESEVAANLENTSCRPGFLS